MNNIIEFNQHLPIADPDAKQMVIVTLYEDDTITLATTSGNEQTRQLLAEASIALDMQEVFDDNT